MFRNLKRNLTIAILSVAVGGVAIPAIVSAQSATAQGNATVAQKYKGGAFKQINLSDAQKQQLKTIHESSKQQVEGVLTSDQRAKLAAAIQSGNKKGAMKSLNLTADQKQKIRDINKSVKEQSLAVLTSEQRTQLQQLRAAHQAK
jgi:Spy/CpxP family protein refolding chaperone